MVSSLQQQSTMHIQPVKLQQGPLKEPIDSCISVCTQLRVCTALHFNSHMHHAPVAKPTAPYRVSNRVFSRLVALFDGHKVYRTSSSSFVMNTSLCTSRQLLVQDVVLHCKRAYKIVYTDTTAAIYIKRQDTRITRVLEQHYIVS